MSLCWNSHFIEQSPLFTPLTPACPAAWRATSDWPALSALNHHLATRKVTNYNGQILQLVEQKPANRQFNESYEATIYLRGELLTRLANWHDFFNMLVWLSLPRIKAMINYLQYHALKQRLPACTQRSPLENKLTHLDENGIIVVSSNQQLIELLQEQRWLELFWQRRAQMQTEMQFFIVGHALYEKLLNPYIGMTGSALIINKSIDFFGQTQLQQLAEIDQAISAYISDQQWLSASVKLTPVPILGIPGCWADNANRDFYENTAYFRSKQAE